MPVETKEFISGSINKHDIFEWTMALNYLKAKKDHDNFSDNFGKANFSMHRINESHMTSEMQRKEVGGLPKELHFGRNFQAQVQKNMSSRVVEDFLVAESG